MKEPITRLFDILEIYKKNFPEKNMLSSKVNGVWEENHASKVYELAHQLAATFLRLGLDGKDFNPENQDKIAIISNNRPEWVIADFATQIVGAVLVPIYPSITDSEWEYILNESQVKIIFISDKNIYKKLSNIIDNVPTLQHIYSFDEISGIDHWSKLLTEVDVNEMNQLNEIKYKIQSSFLATIIYTSGTTGNPKGVMLSHRNIASNVNSCMECFDFCGSNETALSFLPLNHIFERTVLYIYLRKGISVFFAEGMETIGANLKEVKPVVFTTVPRLLEKVYEKIDQKGSELKGFKRKVFNWAVSLALKFEVNKSKSFFYNIQLKIADILVYSKWREAVGGKIKAIVTGSAACQVKLLRLFTAAKIIVMEGYGLTETSPVISVNRYQEKNRKFGTVGTVIKDVEVKIAEDGEILCKGNNIMMGYYKHPELTIESIQNDWFYTGDIGVMLENKFLKITDRKKEIFKISGGKYVAPLPIENKMKESSFIEQIMIVGSNEKFVGALIVPAKEKIKEYFLKLGIILEKEVDITTDKDILKLLRKELDNFNGLFSPHEQVKKFQIVSNEWTIDTGELTATMKLKRKVIMEKYGYLVEKIYN